MGCGSSAFEEVANKPEYVAMLAQFQAMQLSRSQVSTMYNIFHKQDVDSKGQASLVALFVHLHIESTPFTEKAFLIFDDHNSGRVDFKGFVMCVWNYCTLTKGILEMFAFDLYNKNFTGELEPEDVAKLLRDLYGDGETKNSVHAITAMKDLKALERDEKTFKVGQFVAFMQTRQALLYPAYQVQTALRRRLLGESFWEAQIERRMEMSNGQYLPVQKLIITPTPTSAHGDNDAPVAGKAARRKSVAAKKSSGSSTETGATQASGPALGSSTSLTESAKIRLTNSLVGITGAFGRGSRASSLAPSPSKIYAADSTLANSPNLSHANSTIDGQGLSPQRHGSTMAGPNYAVAGGILSPFVSPRDAVHREPGKREANRRHSREKEDLLPGGSVAGTVDAWANSSTLSPSGSVLDPLDAHEGRDHGKKRRGSVAGTVVAGAPLVAGAGAHAGAHPGAAKRRGSVG